VALALGYLAALAVTDRALLPNPAVIVRLLPGAALAAAAGLLLDLPSVIESLLCGAIYLGSAFALGAVPPELLAALRRGPGGSDSRPTTE
jgi:hypothetical protein